MSRSAVEAGSTIETKTVDWRRGPLDTESARESAGAFLDGENAGIASGHCGRERIYRFA